MCIGLNYILGKFMKNFILFSSALFGLTISGLSGCAHSGYSTSKSNIKSTSAKAVKEASAFQYISMDGFSYDLAKFVGLKEGESFAESEVKIRAVFMAYDGQTEPTTIAMDKEIVEADWKQILVTQDGVMDGTVDSQQLLAVFDDDGKLITYGMRIKCHRQSGEPSWQTTGCA